MVTAGRNAAGKPFKNAACCAALGIAAPKVASIMDLIFGIAPPVAEAMPAMVWFCTLCATLIIFWLISSPYTLIPS
ncbi:hypothetical protein D9M68_537610 [compost metagenome]